MDEQLAAEKETFMFQNPEVLLYDTEKKHTVTRRVRLRSPARLSTELNMAIRDAAAKAFLVQALALRKSQINDSTAKP